jgi:hypothetical protein
VVLSHLRLFLSPASSSSAPQSKLVDVEPEKPRKVGRPRKKKDLDAVDFSEVVEPVLDQGDCMTASESVSEFTPETQSQSFDSQKYSSDNSEYGDDGQEEQYYEEDLNEESDDGQGDSALAANQMLVTLSYSLMSQVKQMARMEGVGAGDIILELIAEGVTKRAFQEINRPKPSHLMTRTGYVPPEANGNTMAQPMMSHHLQQAQQGNGSNRGQNNGNRRFGNGGGNQQQNGNGAFFQNRGNQNQRFGNGAPMQNQNQNRNAGNPNNPNAGYPNKNPQRNKRSFNPNFQRPVNGARPPQGNGFVPFENGSSGSEKDGDE